MLGVLERALTTQHRVNDVREQLHLTQDQLHIRAGISRKVIYKAEHGRVISRMSAYAMLKVFNELRRGMGWPELGIDDLDWRLRGG